MGKFDGERLVASFHDQETGDEVFVFESGHGLSMSFPRYIPHADMEAYLKRKVEHLRQTQRELATLESILRC